MLTITQKLKCRTPAKVLALLFTLSASGLSCYAQKIATLEVKLSRPSAALQVPVEVMLDPITHLPDSSLQLVEVQGNKKIPVRFQIVGGGDRKLAFFIKDDVKVKRYELMKSDRSAGISPILTTENNNGALTLKAGNSNLLRYQYEIVNPPEGINPVYGRGAFIHPLWSPRGQVLTRIQPPDHYHHYGLWNPWTHVLYEGDTIDFWNLNAKQGTVRFSSFTSVTSGDIFGEYAALHEHVVYPQQEKEKVALREIQTVRVYAPPANENYYIADITVEMNCADSPVRLLEYRYGGIGWRATEQWTKENSRVLTSEGKTRKEADGSKARWCIVEGSVGGANAGAVMMSYPSNYNHPEPLRIWPENSNRNRGDMFANFSPTKDMDWPLEPGRNYVLKYRFVVFNDTFSKEKAEAAWQDFASPPTVTVLKAER